MLAFSAVAFFLRFRVKKAKKELKSRKKPELGLKKGLNEKSLGPIGPYYRRAPKRVVVLTDRMFADKSTACVPLASGTCAPAGGAKKALV
jgi:hypothetical protein